MSTHAPQSAGSRPATAASQESLFETQNLGPQPGASYACQQQKQPCSAADAAGSPPQPASLAALLPAFRPEELIPALASFLASFAAKGVLVNKEEAESALYVDVMPRAAAASEGQQAQAKEWQDVSPNITKQHGICCRLLSNKKNKNKLLFV